MKRTIIIASLAASLTGSSLTILIQQVATPEPATAAGADTRLLRSIERQLKSIEYGQTEKYGSGLLNELRDLRQDQGRMCRALGGTGCPTGF